MLSNQQSNSYFNAHKVYHQILNYPQPSLSHHQQPPSISRHQPSSSKSLHQQSPSLRLEIELQNGQKVYIIPKKGDRPQRLATQFCEQHNLDNQMIEILTQSIKQSLEHQSTGISHMKSQQLAPISKQQQSKDEENNKNQKLIFSPKVNNNHNEMPCQYFNKKSSINNNLGLYEKGLMFEDAKSNWCKRQKQYNIQKEMRECTHQPKINTNKPKKINKVIQRSVSQQRLISKEKYSVDIKPMKTQLNSVMDLNDLYSLQSSFLVHSCQHSNGQQQKPMEKKQQPSRGYIQPLHHSKQKPSEMNLSSQFSSKIIQSYPLKQITNNPSDVFLKLYQHKNQPTKNKSKAQLESQKEETHHPHINKISQQIIGHTNFDERLKRYALQQQVKQELLKRKQRSQKQNLYHPKIGLPPTNRNAQNLPIGDFLYKREKRGSKKQEKVVCQPSINHMSKQIYNKKKMAAFQKIFQYLDFHKEDKISWHRLDQTRIDADLYRILSPLLEEINIMKIELNLQDFKVAIEFLFNTLNPTDKNDLLGFFISKPKPSQKASQPPTSPIRINKKSKEMVSISGRDKMNIYDFCQLREMAKWQIVEQQRIDKERREMQECTFMPKIQKKMMYF